MIGIILRRDITPSGHKGYVAYEAIHNIIKDYKEIDIGILPNDLCETKKIIDKCDGIILQGGDAFTNLDLEITKYIYDENIPCLGICLGMQTMGYLFNGALGEVANHVSNEDYVHDVIIKNSLVYPDKTIKVNSRHREFVITTDLEVTGVSNDNIIEMIEDKNKDFFVGVEWHPETMVSYDKDAVTLFRKFFEMVEKHKKQ